jgi:hypothetical protein
MDLMPTGEVALALKVTGLLTTRLLLGKLIFRFEYTGKATLELK